MPVTTVFSIFTIFFPFWTKKRFWAIIETMKTVKIPIAMQNTNQNTNSLTIIKSSFYFIFYHIYYIFYNFNPNPRGCNYVHEISDSLFRFLIPVALRLRSYKSPFLLIYHTICFNPQPVSSRRLIAEQNPAVLTSCQ